MRILIVDREPLVCRAAARGAKLRGHECRTASTLEDAARELGEWKPEGVLAGLRLGKGTIDSLFVGGHVPSVLVIWSGNLDLLSDGMRSAATAVYEKLTARPAQVFQHFE